MNTANLQLEGLYTAVAAILDGLREKGLMSAEEIETRLRAAEENVLSDPLRPAQISPANVEAICFPIRLLRLANRASEEGRRPSFTELATEVGQLKPDR